MKRLMTCAALWLGAGASAASAAAPGTLPCLTENEAQAVVLVALPDMLDAVGKACAASLPPSASLRAGLPTLVARYRRDGDAAWNAAKPVIAKIGGGQLQGLDPDMIRPLIGTMMGPMIVNQLKPGDCPRVDRIAALLAPLPVADTAALVVQLFQLGSDHSRKRAPFTICPTHG